LSGTAEEWVGEALTGQRQEVFLVSKVLPENASHRGTVEACERSLTRLKTDRLDCYLLHWRGRHPLSDTIRGFEQLKREGKILSWGVSNLDVSDLREAQAAAAKDDHPACDQVLYHLEERAIEHYVIPWCEKHAIAVVAYSPFGHGQFPSPETAGGQLLRQIAKVHGATPRQVALRFLVRHSSSFAITKASNPEHAAENAGAGDLYLTEAEIARIDRAFPLGPPPRELPML
jgi:diketogulonate reductase-like aldo/keto reductase